MERLNDDCLAHLFALLDINALYAIVRASPTFKRILLLFNSKFEYSITNLERNDLPEFICHVGRHINKLIVTVNENCDNNIVLNFFQDVNMYCVHLKHLHLRKWRYMNLTKCDQMLERLYTLRLDECKYQEKCDMPNKRFTIKPWMIASPAFLSYTAIQKSNVFTNLLNITMLKLQNCASIRPEHLLDFFKCNDRLVHLSLFNMQEFKCSTYDRNYFDEMGKYLRAIEFLSIDMDTTVHINFLADLPRLRSLQLINYLAPDKQIVDQVIRKLCERNVLDELDLYHCHLDNNTFYTISLFSKLSTLRLSKNFWVTDQNLMLMGMMPKLQQFCCFDCILLTGDGFMHIVQMSSKIEQLDCSWCFQVTDQMVEDIITVLREHPKRPKLEIIAGGRNKLSASILTVSVFLFSLNPKKNISHIFHAILFRTLQSNLLTKNSHLLNIKFEPTMPITCAMDDDNFCCNCKLKTDRV